MIDIHSHILPNLDDGSRSLDESLQMARIAYSDGIRYIVATPHAWHSNFNVSPEERNKSLEVLQSALDSQNIKITVIPGMECHVQSNIIADVRLKEEYLFTLPNLDHTRKYLLLEWGYNMPFDQMGQLLFDAAIKNITIILAHAECYVYLQREPELVESFIEQGLKLQVNASNVTKAPFSKKTRTAITFLKRKWVHAIASDGHNTTTRPPLISAALVKASKWYGLSAEKLAKGSLL